MIDATVVEISGAAAAISQTLPIREQAKLAKATAMAENLESVPEPWRSQIEQLIQKKRNFEANKQIAIKSKSDDGKVNDPIAKRTGTAHYSQGRILPVKKYDPDQPRDDRGRFGSGSGGSDSSANGSLGIGANGSPTAHNGKESYREKYGIKDRVGKVNYRDLKVDKERAARISEAYDELPSNDPAAYPAYDALADEVAQQYDYMTNELGIQVEFVDYDPYETARDMFNDVEQNSTLKVLSTASTGSHSYLSDATNDQFRAVHDYFGHAATGRGFMQDGEEAAWVSHSSMFTELASTALTTETRGQNSWYNNHDSGFAEQKTAILPQEFIDVTLTGYKSAKALLASLNKYDPDQPRDASGRWGSGDAGTVPETYGEGNVTPTPANQTEALASLWSRALLSTNNESLNSWVQGQIDEGSMIGNSLDRVVEEYANNPDHESAVKATVAADLTAAMADTSTEDLTNAALGVGVGVNSADPEDYGFESAMTPQTDEDGANGKYGINVVELNSDGNINVYDYGDIIPTDGMTSGEGTLYEVQEGIDGIDHMGAFQYAIAGTPEAEALVRQAAVSLMVHQWAITSNDNDPTSHAMQMAAQEQFGLTDAAKWEDENDNLKLATDKIYEANGQVYRDFLQAQYENTQANFKAAGITELAVYRGIEEGGQSGTGLDVNTRPMSSWSTSFLAAAGFSSDRGSVFRTVIPADQIMSAAGTGFGCLHEFEIVALGGTRTADAILGSDRGTRLDYMTSGLEDPAKVDAVFGVK